MQANRLTLERISYVFQEFRKAPCCFFLFISFFAFKLRHEVEEADKWFVEDRLKVELDVLYVSMVAQDYSCIGAVEKVWDVYRCYFPINGKVI